MELKLAKFEKFNQAKDVKADIKNGWCAGLTALVGQQVGDWIPETGSAGEWVAGRAFDTVVATLKKVNANTWFTQSLQQELANPVNMGNVCGELHKEEYNGRSCKVAMSAHAWVPGIGFLSYAWQWDWKENHVGFIVRGDHYLLLFEPNYGVGLFMIMKAGQLTLTQLTSAIHALAWQYDGKTYFTTNTRALRVFDEDARRLRVSYDTDEKMQALFNAAKTFNV